MVIADRCLFAIMYINLPLLCTMDPEPVLIFDNFDVDLVIKVLSHTLFSTVPFHSPCYSTLTTGRSVLHRAHTCLLFLPRSRAD